jgi:hypothetical protein
MVTHSAIAGVFINDHDKRHSSGAVLLYDNPLKKLLRVGMKNTSQKKYGYTVNSSQIRLKSNVSG